MSGEDVPWSPDDTWDRAEACARTADAAVRDTGSWVPPVEEELVRAARASPLRRWWPTTSHNVLRFADGPPVWLPGGRDDVNELGGCVSFDMGGPDGGAVFRVWNGALFGTPDPVLALTTPSAAEAVRALVRLLRDPSREP